MASKTENRIFWTICIMGAFAILSSTMSKNPVLKPFALSLDTPEGFWTGFVGSASTIPGILVSLPAASLSDVFGRKKFLLIAGFVFASAPFLYLFITVWWHLVLVRFYHGFATAIFVPVAEASMAELFPTKRGERISLFSSATYVGRVTAPILGGYILLTTNKDFHVLYLAVGVAGVTAFIMAWAFLAEGKKQSIIVEQVDARQTLRTMFHSWRIIAKNHAVLILSFVQASQYYTYGTVEYFMAGYLPEVVHLDFLSTGVITASFIAISIFVKPYMGRISDKIGRRNPIIIGLTVSSLPLLAIPFITNFPTLLLLSIVYGIGFAVVTASTPALTSELVHAERVGAAMGFLDMTMDVGQTIGPIISGLILATSLHYAGLFPSLTIILLVSCLIFVLTGTGKTNAKSSIIEK
ncbi:MFS transporter [Candidatus Bathyarchaeota archaeon]|nr:MFS transporter [Candidatus Bathyarchaeota archaeon]